MRSRYSAFVKRDEAYLLQSWHPATRPESVEFDPGLRWTGLEILRVEDGGPSDTKGVVEFRASYVDGAMHEVSRFVRYDDAWVYVRGKVISPRA